MSALPLPFATGLAVAPHRTAEEGLEHAAQQGFTHWYVDLNHEGDSIDQWPAERTGSLRAAARARAVSPIVHGGLGSPLACEIPSHRKVGIERTRREIDFARQMDAPLIVHPSSYYEGRTEPLDRPHAVEALVESVGEIAPIAADCGVELWLENLPRVHPRFFVFDSVFSGTDEYLPVLAASTSVSMVFDIGHANVGPHAHTVAFSSFAPRVAALCFSDNNGEQDAHLPLGAGVIDFTSVLDTIHRLGWRGLVALETIGSAHGDDIAYLASRWRHVADGRDG